MWYKLKNYRFKRNMIPLLRRAAYVLHKVPITKEYAGVQLVILKYFHTNHQPLCNYERDKKELSVYSFDLIEQKKKETFLDLIRLYLNENNNRRGHTEFIIQALKYMDEFGVNKDLEAYKKLLDVFPKGKYIPTNVYQIMLHYFPKQQEVAVALLHKMENNRVIPDREMQDMLLNIFGKQGLPLRKYWRMMYWMPKFASLNPWPLPTPIPTDPKELVYYAVKKISSIDVQSKITIYQTKDVEDSIDDTWIVSVTSPSQQELLSVQPTDKPLYIEGPFNIWIGETSVDYFVLKGEPLNREVVEEDPDDIFNIKLPFWEMERVAIPVSIHELDDGVYYAICATGTSSKDSLLSWIRCLQKTNPVLEKIPIVFKLRSQTGDEVYIGDNEEKQIEQKSTECKQILKEGE